MCIALIWLCVVIPLSVAAAPYAAMVMDARSGKVLHSENANTRLHPASLTKMMTLYVTFEAVQNGEISMDTMVTVSRKAASEPPSKLGLRAGQKIKLRYLVRAAAVKSANDAATAIGEAISGSEAAFALRMNRTAKSMGMTRTTFKNAHGLTEEGHLSTARDMTILGRHVIYDFPMYYNLFSRKTADAGVRSVSHTNSRLLSSYKGADGIKTGYTRAAGFNLTASAERGRERVIATVFGGRSTTTRNARVAELLDLGFNRAPTHVALNLPRKPQYRGNQGLVTGGSDAAVASLAPVGGERPAAGKTIAVKLDVTRSLRPRARPGATIRMPEATIVAAVKEGVADAVAEATAAKIAKASLADIAETPAVRPEPRPAEVVLASAGAIAAPPVPDPVIREQVQEIITRVSTSGGRHWGINIGRYGSHFAAEKVLLKTALTEMSTLDGALRKVVRRSSGFDANFMGLSRETADLACRRLQARNISCFMIGPS
ncbi:D-alanyl-D-alanine carboxypeptidase family protein [Marinovum sp.]|uniref:D-alanyl-D-alanine carboxypeptidase family protein n=1 Tax=Marinovum sp. TaxID=2024839 RepID=UPI002B267B1C|nr:D-alanyl-D-alanine carboxypeptidase family protein [Marinovum sp.]